MIINGEVRVAGFLRVCDLDAGECFAFKDKELLYIKLDDEYGYADLADGTTYFDGDECESPVRRINAEINIIDG